jgi:drug/metabolite transporter (DMT)-like permease
VGAFAVYVALLVAIVPAWRPLLGIGDDPEALKLVFVIGVLAMMVGAAGASLYAWVLKRTPSARATPPRADRP